MPRTETAEGLEQAHVYFCKASGGTPARFKAVVRVKGKPYVCWGKTMEDALAKFNIKRNALLTEGETTRMTRSRNAQTVGRLCEVWLFAVGENVPLGITPADISRRIAQSGVDAY